MSTQSHPLVLQSPRDKSSVADQSIVHSSVTGTITQNSTADVSLTLRVPKLAQITDIIINNDVVWDSAVSATLSGGLTALGTEYLTSVNVKTAAGRIPLTITHVAGTQSLNWASVGSNTTMVFTV